MTKRCLWYEVYPPTHSANLFFFFYSPKRCLLGFEFQEISESCFKKLKTAELEMKAWLSDLYTVEIIGSPHGLK